MQIKQASPIQLKIGQFVSTEQQNKPFNNSLPRKIWSKVQLLKDILSEKYSNSNNLKFRKCHSLQRISKLVYMIDQCEFCTLLILPESSVEPSNIDSTLTKLTITINSAVYKPTTSTLRESQSSTDISCGTLQSLINHQLVHTTHSGFDPNVDDRIVLDYNLENTKNCTRTYFSCRSHDAFRVRSKRRPPHKHVLVDYADRVALCAPPQLHQTSDTDFASQLTQLTLTKGSLITNASIIDTHSASMPISHARTISRNDTLPDDESDIPTAATLVMSVHSPLASLAARHSALASLAARHSALASLAPRLSALASLAPRLSALASLAPRLSALASLAPCLSALASLAARHSALASLAARHSALASLAPRLSALASLAPRLSALASLAPRLSALASLAPCLSALASLASRHSALASLAARLSALASLAPHLSALASLAPCLSALASLAARHSALASLAPRLSALASLAPHLSALAFLAPRLSALASLAPRLSALASLAPRLSALASLAARHSALASLAPRLSALASLAPRLSALASLAPHLSALAFLAPCLSALASLAPRLSALASLAPRLSALAFLAPRLSALASLAPRLSALASLAPRLSALASLAARHSALAFLAPCLSALASLASRHSALASLAARLSALAFLAPRLSAPALPTATQTYPLWPCIILSNCSPQCPKPARDLELVILSGRERTGRTPNISQPSPPSPNLLSTLTKQTTYPSLQPTPSQHRQDRNKTALPEIIVRTESVFPLPFNNKANPLSQLTISNEILGGMGNQISLFTKYPPSTTDQPPKLPKHPAHIHNPLNCYQTWRKRRRPFHHHQKSEGRLRRMNARKSGNAEYWDEPPEAHQPHLEAGTISEPLSDIQEESQNEKIPRDWDSYGDTIAETNKAQEEKEKTLVKEAKTELKEENDQLTRNEDTKETTIDSDTQPYHPLNNLSNLLPAILPRTEAEQDIIIDCVEWSLARFDCHSVTTVQTVNRHSLARLISFTRHSLLELPEVKGMGMADELEWLCRVEFIFDLCEAVSKAKDESGTLEADLVDIKPQHTQTRLDAEQLRQDEWEIVVKSILHTHTFPTSEAPNWKCASFS
ncbi:putative kxYKxGKxW signal peptide domain protein [Blattamonas nauphoetae]|uniref:KxYKxGKxW signal peptide domain protein n=1 Tax=Blattamonas nauphoetae TaxID=2049346 RepID=A0ABQ9XBY4_9EUKA|nr:putative kxYKxGKxW signal peptide domain protein [Blattamonas nauphoetae]